MLQLKAYLSHLCGPAGTVCRAASTLLLALIVAAACSEQTENSAGLPLVPSDQQGGMPTSHEFSAPLEAVQVDGDPIGTGGMQRVFAGGRNGFLMRPVLAFRISLPQDFEIVEATLQLFVLGTSGDLPVDLSVHLLDREFVEEEVNYRQAEDGVNWSSAGGDYSAEVLGQASFEGNRVDTVAVTLDSDMLNSILAAGSQDLPLIVTSTSSETYIGFIAREYAPSSAVSSLLTLTYRLQGETSQSLLERRALMDATLAFPETPVQDNGLLRVGEVPSSQVFLAYDLDELPPLATINKASLMLYVSDMAVVDSFHVSAHISTGDDREFVPPDEIFYGEITGIGASDTLVTMNMTLPLQRLLLERAQGASGGYLVVSSYHPTNVAGYVDFHPVGYFGHHNPRLEVIYTEPPAGVRPGD